MSSWPINPNLLNTGSGWPISPSMLESEIGKPVHSNKNHSTFYISYIRGSIPTKRGTLYHLLLTIVFTSVFTAMFTATFSTSNLITGFWPGPKPNSLLILSCRSTRTPVTLHLLTSKLQN